MIISFLKYSLPRDNTIYVSEVPVQRVSFKLRPVLFLLFVNDLPVRKFNL